MANDWEQPVNGLTGADQVTPNVANNPAGGEVTDVRNPLRPLWGPLQYLNSETVIMGSVTIAGIDEISPDALPSQLVVQAINDPFDMDQHSLRDVAVFEQSELNTISPEEVIARIHHGLEEAGVPPLRPLESFQYGYDGFDESWALELDETDIFFGLKDALKQMDTVVEVGDQGYFLTHLHVASTSPQPGRSTIEVAYWPDKGTPEHLATFDLKSLLLANPYLFRKQYGADAAVRLVTNALIRKAGMQLPSDELEKLVKTEAIQSPEAAWLLSIAALERDIRDSYSLAERNEFIDKKRDIVYLRRQLDMLKTFGPEQRSGWLSFVLLREHMPYMHSTQPESMYVAALTYMAGKDFTQDMRNY